MGAKNSFNREEHLKSRKIIATLFEKGESVPSPLFRVLWLRVVLPLPNIPVQICISVPSSKFKTAVIRNRIKRKTVEAYRTNKHELIELVASQFLSNPENNFGLALMFIYSPSEEKKFSEIEFALKEVLQKLIKNVSKTADAG